MSTTHKCWGCGEPVDARRWDIGKRTCMDCGEAEAKRERQSWCVAPMHKSNYMLITDMRDLLGLNNKGGIIK